MSRPIKSGLDYFPLDTTLDDNFDIVESKFGPTGFMVVIKMYQKIYGTNGYFYEWSEKEQLLFSKRINVDINLVNEIINYCLELGLFSKEMFSRGVITSRGIQKRYIEATIRRRSISFYSDLLLVNADIIPVIVGKNPRSVVFNEYISTQSKVNEMKRNEIKSKNTDPQNAVSDSCVNSFDSFLKTFITAWNSCGCTPRFSEVLSINLTSDERDKFGKASSRIKDIPRALKAIKNYSDIQKSSSHQLHGSYKLPGFLVSGIDEYSDDANPFERFKKPESKPINPNQDDLISRFTAEADKENKSAQARYDRSFDDDYEAEDDEQEENMA